MKLRILSLSLFVTLLAVGALFTGCTSTTSPTTTDTRSKVVSSSTDTYIDVTGLSDNQLYEFTVAGSSAATVTGFSSYANGTIRVFWTRGSGDNGSDTVYYKTTSSTTADAGYAVWATADVSGPIRLYETADTDPNHPSGLIIGNSTTSKAVSIGATNNASIDLVLLTDNTLPSIPFLAFLSADASGLTGLTHTTKMAGAPYGVLGGLAMNHFLSDVSSNITATNEFDVTTNSDSSSFILLVKTADGHLARVEVIPQAAKTTVKGVSGHFLWGDTAPGQASSKRYIDVNVTYQPTVGWGYVSRPGELRTGTNAPRIKMGPVLRGSQIPN